MRTLCAAGLGIVAGAELMMPAIALSSLFVPIPNAPGATGCATSDADTLGALGAAPLFFTTSGCDSGCGGTVLVTSAAMLSVLGAFVAGVGLEEEAIVVPTCTECVVSAADGCVASVEAGTCATSLDAVVLPPEGTAEDVTGAA